MTSALSLLSRFSIAVGAVAFLYAGNTLAIFIAGVIALIASFWPIKKGDVQSVDKIIDLICVAMDTLLVFLFVPLFFQAGLEWWLLLTFWLTSSFIIPKIRSNKKNEPVEKETEK